MTKNFNTLFESIISEMAASFPRKHVEDIAAELERLHTSGESVLYPKPLVDIKDPSQRRKALDSIIDSLFEVEGEEFINVDVTTKSELQSMIKGAVESASKDANNGFRRPIVGVAAERLGKWLGTNIKANFTGSGDVTQKEMKQALKKKLDKEVEDHKEEAVAEEPAETEQQADSSATLTVAPFNKYSSYIFKPQSEIPSGSLSLEQKRIYDEVAEGDPYEGKDLIEYLQDNVRFTSSESQNRSRLEAVLNSLLRKGFLEQVEDESTSSSVDSDLEDAEDPETLKKIADDRARKLETGFGSGGFRAPRVGGEWEGRGSEDFE